MDSQQLWAADDKQVIFQEHDGKTPPLPTPFHLDDDDDAFADGDDNDSDYEFSSTVIRTELARAVSSHEVPTIEKSLEADAAGEANECPAGISLLVRMPAYHSTSTSSTLQGRIGPPPRW
jgi:hypothetical protein